MHVKSNKIEFFKKRTLKLNLQDMLFVIAHGAASARAAAANLLFFYWPMLNPTGMDRRSIHFKFTRKDFSNTSIYII